MQIRVCVLVYNVSESVGLWNTNKASPYCESADNTPVHNCEIVSGSDDIVYNKGKLVCSTHRLKILFGLCFTKSLISKECTTELHCGLSNAHKMELFEDYSGANQWRQGAAHETVVLKKSGLLVHLIVIKRAIFCAASLREMLTGPPTTRCNPWSPPSRRCWSTSQWRTSRGSTAGSGRGWGRPSLLRIIYSAKCQVYMKRNNFANFITLSFSKDFLQ